MRTKTRGNGRGCAYKRGKVWEAQITIGWKLPDDFRKNPIQIKHRKSGFRTKSDALDYIEDYLRGEIRTEEIPSLAEVFDSWKQSYTDRIKPTTMAGYVAAFKWFEAVHEDPIDEITATDLQQCLDKCTAGKRTHQMMKVTAGLIWAYAIDSGWAEKNVTKNLYTGNGKSESRKPITDEQLDVIRNALSSEEYAELVYCQCYLGFRPGELLGLKKADVKRTDNGTLYIVAGGKTEAGTDRTVIVPKQIRDIVLKRLDTQGTDLLFPMIVRDRKGNQTGYKQMTTNYYNHAFHAMLSRLGLPEDLVPYSARHTYADKLKHADGDDRDKAALMGHTDYDFTRKQYQTSQIEDLAGVVESIK